MWVVPDRRLNRGGAALAAKHGLRCMVVAESGVHCTGGYTRVMPHRRLNTSCATRAAQSGLRRMGGQTWVVPDRRLNERWRRGGG